MSTAGKRLRNPSRSDSRTPQPVRTTRVPGRSRLSSARRPCRPITRASACSRTAQVLITIRSAASIDPAGRQPTASSWPAISSESLWFIWQPSVQTQKEGIVSASGRNSASRASMAEVMPAGP